MATSCESKRSSAYSEDLRWRMVYQSLGLRLPNSDIAKNLCVDVSTVERTVKLYNQTGSVSKKKYDKSNLPRKLTETVKFYIIELILQHPGIYLREVEAELQEILAVELSESAICGFLRSHGFSRQKMQIIARQRDEIERLRFVSELTVYTPEMFIFLDETGSDKRNAHRRYAYSWRGKPARTHKLLVRGQRMNAIAFMSVDGLLDCHIEEGNVDGDVFFSTIQRVLVPHIMPFNGTNPHNVIVLDNASIHHIDEVVELLHSLGALVLFLPPYSPDYNPIEEAFSKVKSLIRDYEVDAEMQTMNMQEIILTAFSKIM